MGVYYLCNTIDIILLVQLSIIKIIKIIKRFTLLLISSFSRSLHSMTIIRSTGLLSDESSPKSIEEFEIEEVRFIKKRQVCEGGNNDQLHLIYYNWGRWDLIGGK